jgi:hypothetical protein
MIRKVFILGKVRDIDTTKDADNTAMTDELRKDLKEFLHQDIDVKLVKDENKIKVSIFAHYHGKVDSGEIPVPITWLITGECENFKLKYPMFTFSYFPELNNQISLRYFTELYEKNAIHYGATEFKKVKIAPNPYVTSLILDY